MSGSGYKVVFIGESGVGKSSIIRRLVQNKFDSGSVSTIGAAFNKISIPINDNTVSLNVWDTAGQERFNALIPMYIKDAVAIFIIYDVTYENSFNKIKTRWLKFINNHCQNETIIYICANKVDLIDPLYHNQISDQLLELKDLVSGTCRTFNTSAKNGLGIHESFNQLAIELHKKKNIINKRLNNDDIDDPLELQLINNSGCCF